MSDQVLSRTHYNNILSHPSVVVFLAKNGINLNLKDDEGNTPLHIAASEVMVETVKVLLDHGANKFSQNNQQQLPGAMPKELDPEKPKTKKSYSYYPSLIHRNIFTSPFQFLKSIASSER